MQTTYKYKRISRVWHYFQPEHEPGKHMITINFSTPRTGSSTTTPVNIISGFLGVGKTTTLNHILATKPKDELWAVLINEYGEVGLDSALLASHKDSDDLAIREIAGGCICCTAGLMFQMSLALLMQRYQPDRLLIEPTGIATIDGMLDTLAQPGVAENLDIRSIITLVDPAHWHDPTYREHDTYRAQIQAADILLANRTDLTDKENTQGFLQDAQKIYPPKQHIDTISHGKLDLALLDLVRQHQPTPSQTANNRLFTISPVQRTKEGMHHHSTKDAQTCGWIYTPEHVFEFQRLANLIDSLTQLPGFLRLKGVLRTTTGWWAYNITPAQDQVEASSYRRDSRLEVITKAGEEIDWSQWHAQLDQAQLDHNP